jgi:hypothetical protein
MRVGTERRSRAKRDRHPSHERLRCKERSRRAAVSGSATEYPCRTPSRHAGQPPDAAIEHAASGHLGSRPVRVAASTPASTIVRCPSTPIPVTPAWLLLPSAIGSPPVMR